MFAFGLGDEKTRRISVAVALNFAAGRSGRVLVITDSAKRRSVQERTVVQMQHEDRSVWSDCVDLIERRHAAFGELKFGPATDHSYPLRRGRPCRLILQHAQCIGERRYTVPAQFHVVVEPAPDRMHVRIVETRDDRSSAPVNYARLRTPQTQNLVILADSGDFSGRYGDGFDKRGHPIRGDLGVVQYESADTAISCLDFPTMLRRAEAASALRSLLVGGNSSGNHVLGKFRGWRTVHHGVRVLDTDPVGSVVVLHDVHHGVVGVLVRPVALPFEHDVRVT